MEQTANSKEYFEVYNTPFKFLCIHRLSAALIIAVSLHIHDPLEVIISEVDLNKNSVGKTVDLQVWPVEV